MVELRWLGLGVCSGVGIKGLSVRVSGELPLCIFMVFERSGLCCSAAVVIISIELRCNGADDPVDWAGKGEELLSSRPIFPAFALSERPDDLGSGQTFKFSTLSTSVYGWHKPTENG